ncbi:Cytochrome P450 [Nostocoides japonicum T1-X7]|uniref:Cytochrome P450 n=1 Tax=Nostocoides japonicum T1-X7 TaxID=1194083 RepID=A0A077M0Y6_9MICO|nr:cytochrome P450 [Tetrasphaera japonica]CCH79496.1 Cytochrome P450 [Tetrasphaera japonica T1-X7]
MRHAVTSADREHRAPTLTERLSRRTRRIVMKRAQRRIDLSRLDSVPESLVWPLAREGVSPTPRLAEIRDREPVHRLTSFLGMTIWVVTGEAECRQVLADTGAFSNDIRPFVGGDAKGLGGAPGGYIGGLGFTDPPEHTRLRKLLTPEFTMRRLERLRPHIVRIVDRRLDAVAADLEGPTGIADLVPSFAFPVPFQVICELLGLPDDDAATFQELGAARFDVSAGGVSAFGAMSDSRAFLMEFTKRQRADPGDGLIGQLVRDHGGEIDDVELAGLADGVFTGGLETSASMLALGAAVLLDHPEHYARVGSDPSVIGVTVEELLRYLTVVQIAFPRFPLRDLEIGGVRVRQGDVVICHLAAADRDARRGPQMDAFDPTRPVGPHLAFGHGFHRCVGAELARLELQTAFPALARRFPDLVLASDRLPHRERSIVFGVESVPVRRSTTTTGTTPG